MVKDIYVKKSNGDMELFSIDKLQKSLLFTGASKEDVNIILNGITPQIHDGISTKNIYKLSFSQLRKLSRPLSAFYGTKRALLELGPDGYLFERFISRVFNHLGYSTKVSVIMNGKCISHEVDVIAESPKKNILIECKFHNSRERKNDIKTALYVKARADDIQSHQDGYKYDEFWLVSNTHFSEDAIQYSTCAGLHLWGANFPPQNTLQDIIRDHGLHPITCLSTLKKIEKKMLLESEVLMTKELEMNPSLLTDIGIETTRINRIREEIKKINKRRKK
jgi:hypothetical protein